MKSSKSILVIDDDQEMLTMLSRVLEIEGYAVVTTSESSSATFLLEKHQPDLVILDIMMPGLDGFQILTLIRQRSTVPVIMLTGIREVTTVRDTLALGADDYVRKPFPIQELLARIKSKLRRVALGSPRPLPATAFGIIPPEQLGQLH